MYIYELVVEITRRCNVACQHCLRGDPQNKNISDLTVDKVFESITGIGTLTFTGGEPSLAVDRIRYITKKIKENGITLGGFYIITNGKIPSTELAHALIDLYPLTNNMEEMGGLIISKDQYHSDQIASTKEAEKLYSALTFYRPREDHEIDDMYLIGEGRAEGRGEREASLEPLIVETKDNKPINVENTLYINALGDVVPGCDLSYESQTDSQIGNVHKKSLADILMKSIRRKD
jgi:organic radical activating enzyme